jgi:hypothetical protein
VRSQLRYGLTAGVIGNSIILGMTASMVINR